MPWRMRTSTVLLIVVFFATLVLYFLVRPGPQTRATFVDVRAAPTTHPRSSTTTTAPTTTTESLRP